jgi:hypothetical protein
LDCLVLREQKSSEMLGNLQMVVFALEVLLLSLLLTCFQSSA